METKEKYTKEERAMFMKFKEFIQNKAEEQRFLKNQRKTVNKDCSRKFGDMPDISPSEATWKHAANREQLRVLYAAYGILKGKSYSEIENRYPEENHPLKEYEHRIERVLKEHKFLKEED